MVVAPRVLKNAGYDVLRDFTPIAVAQSYGLYLVVNPALPIHDVASFVAYLKANPGHYEPVRHLLAHKDIATTTRFR
jgi:tripartite-type tricarboxylate transporter receptor subunit TctC